MKNHLQILILFLLVCNFHVYATDSKIKFGDVSEEDIRMETYMADTSAQAVILNDYGKLNFDVSTSMKCIYERIIRIKILTKEGLEYANISIPLYRNGATKETLGTLKGYTYNIENGKVSQTKLEKESIHRENTSDYYETYKITFPNVESGSVIELKYSISSNMFGKLRGWNFQSYIPVRESVYTAEILEYFVYKVHLKGFETLDKYEIGSGSEHGIPTKNYYWEAFEMPAFNSEPYMLASEGFIAGLDFELAAINIPGSKYEDFSKNWESVKTELLSVDGYGDYLNDGNFFKDVVDEIEVSNTDEQSKTRAAFEYIQDLMKWNESSSIFPSASLRKSFKEKTGNCTDINLMLVVLLNRLGVESHPVLVSSRDNGMLNFLVPKRSAFDYMITLANVDGQEILLDPTEAASKCGDLPFRCLNDKGLKIAPGPVTWIDLSKFQGTRKVVCSLYLTDPENINGIISYTFLDYSAYMFRQGNKDKTDDKIIEEFEEAYDWISVEDFTLKDDEQNEHALTARFNCKFSNFIQESGDYLYINPILVERHESNPFTLDERKYPVDFGYKTREDLVVMITYPADYQVETLPEPLKVVLPDNAGEYTYIVKEVPNGIQILSKVEINKSVFLGQEYNNIKELYNHIVSKQSEMIVLKKQS